MRRLLLVIRWLIPFAVLYTIGYFVPGFSALTIPWIILLTVIIEVLNWLVLKLLGRSVNRLSKIIISFLAAAVIIFTVTLAIDGGNVPFGGSLLAAAIIAFLTAWLSPGNEAARHRGPLR